MLYEVPVVLITFLSIVCPFIVRNENENKRKNKNALLFIGIKLIDIIRISKG